MTVYTSQQAHDDITALFDAYYDAKKADAPITTNERIEHADTLIERYIEANGIRPPDSVLSRLGTYILLDYYSNSNPHKVSTEDYPTLSDNQVKRRENREKPLSKVYTGVNDVTIGRKKGVDGVKRRLFDFMTPERDSSLIPTEHLSLYMAIDVANLTDRQRQAIDLIYYDGLTQEAASDVMDVSRRTLRSTVDGALAKISRKLRRI